MKLQKYHKPNIFMNIGAAKAGTTWLYQMLRDHNEIYFSPEKELHYFSSKNGGANRLKYEIRYSSFARKIKFSENLNLDELRKLFDWYTKYLSDHNSESWYQNLFQEDENAMYWADFSNSTCLMNKKGIRQLINMYDKVQLLYTLRDPVNRLWSHLKFHLHWTGKPHLIKEWDDNDFIKFARQKFIIENGNYVGNIQKFSKYFNDDQLMIIFFEDMLINPICNLNKIEKFLDIEQRTYSVETVSRVINKSPNIELSENLKAIFRELLDKQYRGLGEMGLSMPTSWNTSI